MRALAKSSQPADRDRGAVMVMVALLLTVVLGVGALTIDLGALYAEKRQLQTGADAAALAIAQDCAQGNCVSPASTATHYANLNAHDGVSAVDFVCGSAPTASPGLIACTDPAPAGVDGAAGWVRVRTSTLQPDGSTRVPFLLAPIMNSLAGKKVTATTTVAWGSPAADAVLPVIFSLCEYIGTFHGSLNPPTFPSGQHTITFHGDGSGSCKPSPSGQDLPGGFGYLDSTNCVATINAGGWVNDKTGNSFPCDLSYADAWLNKTVVIAIYDETTGTGTGGRYHVAGFAGFKLLGYKFQGNRTGPSGFKCKDDSGRAYANSVSCISGEFTRVTTDGGSFGGTDFGTRIVKVVG